MSVCCDGSMRLFGEGQMWTASLGEMEDSGQKKKHYG